MAIVFPNGIDNFTNPSPADNLNTPAVLHTDQHSDLNDAVEALEAKVGINGSLVTGTLDFRVVQLESGSSHAPVTLGTANGLSLVGQQLSLALSATGTTGALSGADWFTFNSKQNALGFTPVPNTRLINTTSPLAGGGDLSTDRTLSMPQATGTQSGYLSGADWVIFNSKQSALSFPLAANLGGSGIANSGTFTNHQNLIMPANSAGALTNDGSGGLTWSAAGSGDISGTGIVGRVAQFVTNTKTIEAANLIGPTGSVLTIVNNSAKTIIFPGSANDTVAMLGTANVYTIGGQMVDNTTDSVELRLQSHSTKTTDYLTFENSSGVRRSYFNALGEFYFNNLVRDVTLTPSINITKNGMPTGSSAALIATIDVNGMTTTDAYGLAFTGFIRPGLGNTMNRHVAIFAAQSMLGTGGTTAFGAVYNARFAFGGSTGTMTNAYIMNTDQYSMSGGPTVTNLYGFNLPTLSQTGGTVVNQYGINLGNVDKGTTLNYAIFTAAGAISFLGSMTKASAAGTVWKGIELRAATLTITGNTNITNAAGVNYFDIARPTLSAALGVVITNSATMYVANSPIGAGSGTITNPYSIWVDDGLTRLDGGLAIEGSVTKNVFYGTYIPTGTAAANLDGTPTFTEAQYLRVGNTVTVSGRFTADPTLPATTTSFEITLPIASNIGAVEDAAGVAFCGNIAGMGAEVIASVANDTAVIQWKSSDTTSQTWSFTFTYQVI